MSEHLSAAHVGQTIQWWCRICERETKHRVDAVSSANPAGKLGPCLEHTAKVNARGESKRQEIARKKREQDTANPALFGDGRHAWEEE